MPNTDSGLQNNKDMHVMSAKKLIAHKLRIRQKVFLRRLYTDFYLEFIRVSVPEGRRVELGSGQGFIKQIVPHAVTSDVVAGPDIDQVFSAEKMPYANASVSAFFMLNVFHHLKGPEKALTEMSRCLKVGGKVVMIEPYASFWGKLIYKYVHHERYAETKHWQVKGADPLADSNLALPWMIFVRDRKVFEMRYPQLRINSQRPHTPLRYLISGGLTQWQFFPSAGYQLVAQIEKLLTALHPYIGMFTTIELEKIGKRRYQKR